MGTEVRTWDIGLQRAQEGSKVAQRELRTQSRGRSQKTNNAWWEALEARSLTGGQRREKRKSMPQPAGGIWSSQGHSFATLIKGFLLLALPCCGFPRQKWLCYWVSTGAWKQLWVRGLPGSAFLLWMPHWDLLVPSLLSPVFHLILIEYIL